MVSATRVYKVKGENCTLLRLVEQAKLLYQAIAKSRHYEVLPQKYGALRARLSEETGDTGAFPRLPTIPSNKPPKRQSLLTTRTILSARPNFLGEVVRCGASRKKPSRDSTLKYSPGWFTFRDVPQMAAYHKKLITSSSNAPYSPPSNA